MTTLRSHLQSLSIVTCSTGLSHRFATYRLSFPLQTRVCQTHAWGWCFYSTTWRVRVSLTGTLSCQGSMTLPLIPCTLRYNFERTGRTHSVHTDRWDSLRQKELILCSNIFRQISFISSLPPAGNANRWATPCKINVFLAKPFFQCQDFTFLAF